MRTCFAFCVFLCSLVNCSCSRAGREDLTEDCEGSLIDFLGEFEGVISKFTYHRYILAKDKRASQELHRNCLPGTMKRDCDFAENYTIIAAKEIQSQYWLAKQCTLFIAISNVLLTVDWDKRDGALEKGGGYS